MVTQVLKATCANSSTGASYNLWRICCLVLVPHLLGMPVCCRLCPKPVSPTPQACFVLQGPPGPLQTGFLAASVWNNVAKADL